MSVKAYSHYDRNMDKSMNYELWLLKKLYLAWVGLWDLIHALHKYALRVFMVCSYYVMVIYELIMLMTYAFPLSSK